MSRVVLFASSLIAALASIAAGHEASGQTLDDALAIAYQTNPNLLAARAQLRATDELVAQAKAQRRPTVGITGSMTYGVTDNLCSLTGDLNLVQEDTCAPSAVRLDIVQPVFRGGSIEADIDQAENLVRAQRAALAAAEQDVLLGAATAYVDVYRDQAVLDLTQSNESVVAAERNATRNRFDVGAVTQTDVVQAESRLARATAQRIEAEASLAVSKATYRELIGEVAGVFGEPPLALELPQSEEVAVQQSASNPSVIATEFAEKAARDAIDSAFGELLPSFDLIGELRARDDLINDSLFDEDQTASITARVKIPLYQAGSVDSRVRAAKHRAGQLRNQVEAQRRAAAREAESAWQSLTSARAQKLSFEAEVGAADLALKGVRREAELGARTVLDILDAEQELLDAQVNLVRARRDEIVSAYAVLAAIGQLAAERLALDVSLYDVEQHYESVRGKFWGTDIDEE
jgi:TolC family type I secretion outer membrane protein